MQDQEKPLHIYHRNDQGMNIIYSPATKKVFKSLILPERCRNFFVMKGDYHNEAGEIDAKSLVKFYKDFKTWCEELKECNIDYDKYHTHYDAVRINFHRWMGKSNKELVDNMEKITLEEDRLFDRCHNGGMTVLNPEYVGKTVQCYGYDFSANYPSLMTDSDFLIPTTSYRKEIINEVPDTFQLGIYRVRVSSKNPDFNKVFAFSKFHTYTNYSLNWALEIRDRFGVGTEQNSESSCSCPANRGRDSSSSYWIKLEIINDGKPNAFIYDNYVSGSQLFGSWYRKLMFAKKKFPKNRLVKHLLSSLWGSLCMKNNKYISVDDYKADTELQKRTIILEHHFKGNDTVGFYEICDIDNLYKVNIRLKSFLTSYARVNISRVILDNIDSFVRCQTDNATFTREIDYEKYPRLLPEDKTTGKIHWSNVNKYQKVE